VRQAVHYDHGDADVQHDNDDGQSAHNIQHDDIEHDNVEHDVGPAVIDERADDE